MLEQVLQIFPAELRKMLLANKDKLKETEEIRIRINQPMILWDGRKEYFLDKLSGRLSVEAEGSYYIKESDISAMLTFLSRYSIYAYEEELKIPDLRRWTPGRSNRTDPDGGRKGGTACLCRIIEHKNCTSEDWMCKGNSALYPNGTESEKYAFRIFRWDWKDYPAPGQYSSDFRR